MISAHDAALTHSLTAAAFSTDSLLSQEWLLTNGTGSYAMGTALGCNTRRYHGLLVAASHPPVGRIVALSQLFEQLILTPNAGGDTHQTLEFSTCQFRGGAGERIFAPRGQEMLQRFERGLSVQWHYAWGEVEFTRELLLHWKQPAATVRYTIRGLDAAGCTAQLRLYPMLTLRDFHAMLHQQSAGDFEVSANGEPGVITVARDEASVTFSGMGGVEPVRYEHGANWWNDVHYPADSIRGQEDQEDYFVPGHLAFELVSAGPSEVLLTAALGDDPAAPEPYVTARARHLTPIQAHLDRVGPLPEASGSAALDSESLKTLFAIASDDFVVDRTVKGKRLSTILAGYPWFADWGRDTFIALPGLLLCTGRFGAARDTLRAFAEAIGTDEHNGLVPNRFDDYDDTAAHYNTVDGSLWFIHAAMSYVQASGDTKSWKEWLAKACCRIVDAYTEGTSGPIAMANDGLIEAGTPNTQLTWMDAACGGDVFTPRPGKCVEINALWHHVLAGLAAALPESLAGKAEGYAKRAKQVKRSFGKVFWREETGCLYDHVYTDPEGSVWHDQAIRPNQIFAVSLTGELLSQKRAKQVVACVRGKLLTPVGLRTLPQDDPAYHARYSGDQYVRDQAYHQGTIWPWPIGHYAEAVLRVGKFSDKSRQEALAAIRPLIEAMQTTSIGQLHEIYEADPQSDGTHRPCGCIAQAWSISEVLRVWQLICGEAE